MELGFKSHTQLILAQGPALVSSGDAVFYEGAKVLAGCSVEEALSVRAVVRKEKIMEN